MAASLAKQKGTLVIKIENSEMEVVESICKHQGTFLSLSGEATRSLSDKAFNNLSNHKGNIEFFDLDELSDFGAKMLSKHKGNLFFEALFELSESAKESLSKYQGEINRLPAKEWVESL